MRPTVKMVIATVRGHCTWALHLLLVAFATAAAMACAVALATALEAAEALALPKEP